MSKVIFKFDVNKTIKNIEAKADKAQFMLKNEVAKNTLPYVPFNEGTLARSVIKSVNNGTKWLIWDTAYAHFQYIGVVMRGVISNKVWANENEIKYPTNKKLKYGRKQPNATARWFEVAKEKKLKHWVDVVRKVLTR